LLVHMIIASSTASGLAFVLLFAFQCKPASYYWNKDQDGSCLDLNIVVILTYIGSVMYLICDLYFAILPMLLIRGLKMDRSTKIALRFILGLGCL
jgi:hypothetical protein